MTSFYTQIIISYHHISRNILKISLLSAKDYDKLQDHTPYVTYISALRKPYMDQYEKVIAKNWGYSELENQLIRDQIVAMWSKI